MSCSKFLPPFTFDLLCYLNRDRLERFSIVCRPLKNLIARYFHSKPYRVFDELEIRGGSYALTHNVVQWHPNREDYSVQQFLAEQECNIDWSARLTYSFVVMHRYLGPTVRIKHIVIYIAGDSIYNSEHVAEMESIAYLWRDGNVDILRDKNDNIRIVAQEFQPILNSPTILQCRKLCIENAHFSFKDYAILYTVNVIEICHFAHEEIDHSYWTEFLEQPGVKPIVALQYNYYEDIVNAVECFKKAFSSAVVPSAFKVVFAIGMEIDEDDEEPLIEFRETNKTLGEKLELKKGLPTNCESIDAKDFGEDLCYTLERSSI